MGLTPPRTSKGNSSSWAPASAEGPLPEAGVDEWSDAGPREGDAPCSLNALPTLVPHVPPDSLPLATQIVFLSLLDLRALSCPGPLHVLLAPSFALLTATPSELSAR